MLGFNSEAEWVPVFLFEEVSQMIKERKSSISIRSIFMNGFKYTFGFSLIYYKITI